MHIYLVVAGHTVIGIVSIGLLIIVVFMTWHCFGCPVWLPWVKWHPPIAWGWDRTIIHCMGPSAICWHRLAMNSLFLSFVLRVPAVGSSHEPRYWNIIPQIPAILTLLNCLYPSIFSIYIIPSPHHPLSFYPFLSISFQDISYFAHFIFILIL